MAKRNDKERLAVVDAFLADKSWDNTFLQMQAAITEGLHSLAS